MTETFEHPDDHIGSDDHGHDSGGHDEPAFSHDDASGHHEPPAHDASLPDDLSADTPADDAPTLDDDDPGTPSEDWHADPTADDDLRAWLDDPHPALDPPAGFEQRLADDLASDAARHASRTEDLVRDVLDRLKGS
jgi:hypothetical protein